jgi:peptide/nickel transport system permease protein
MSTLRDALEGGNAAAAPGDGVPTTGRAEAGDAHRSASATRVVLRTFVENRLALVSLAIIILVAGFCFIGPVLYPTDQAQSNILNANLPPGGGHPLGTDESGFDILGRLMAGGQSSLEVGLAVAIMATTIGVLWGAIAGFFGGLIDSVMMRFVDIMLAIPLVFLFIFLASVVRPNLVLLIVVLALLSWLGPARLVRGETLSLRTREYVQATRVMGGSNTRVVLRHIVPNAFGTIIVNATFQVADAILALALLSFLGFGLPPPAATWGGMLANGTNYLFDGYWWEVYPAGLLIVMVVLAFNFIGDALRDAMEVRLQRR